MMIHIEGDSVMIRDDEEPDEDVRYDAKARLFIEDLKELGPYSKQILNYTYPPLLY